MIFILFFLMFGVVGLVIAANLKGKPLVNESRYGTTFSETEEDKKRRLQVGLVCGLSGTISVIIAVYLLFVISI